MASRPYIPGIPNRYIALIISLIFFLGVLISPAELLAAPIVLDDGIEYNQLVKTMGGDEKVTVNYLLVDPTKPKVEFKPVMAGKGLGHLDTLSNMAKEYGAVAAVNGAFYSMSGSLIPIDTTIIDGQLQVKSGREATSLICLNDKRIMIEQLNPGVNLMLPDKKMIFKVDTFNINISDGLAVFTSDYGPFTKTGGDSLEYVVRPEAGGMVISEINMYGGTPIPEGGLVISMQGYEKPYRYDFQIGDRVAWSLDYRGIEGVKHLLSNGPLLVKNGCKTVPLDYEELDSSLANRHPRTAVGVTRSGKALLVTVDGRSEESVGMTFSELADLMIELGAYDAMALDGGGSTEMVVGGNIVNTPSDGKERRINTAILVISQIPVYLDNQRIYFEVPPVNQKGRVLVPVRKLFESLGASVEWDDATRTVSAVRGETRVELPIGKKTARVNGKKVTIDSEAIIINGRTMVPLRFVSQALGAKVSWDGATQSVYINR